MKKKTIALLLCMMMVIPAGCGNKNANVEGTETVVTEGSTEAVLSADMEYDVNDYVKLGDYMDVEVTLNSADYVVNDEAVNSYVDQLISYYQPYQKEDAKTTVEKGDVVDVDYVGKKDGEAFEGGSATAQLIDTSSNTNIASGTGYIDGFADGLVGANVGDTIDHEVTFPEDYASEELKGQTVTFTFTINSIGHKVTRENIDDAYVAENLQNDLQVSTVDEVYANVKTLLEQQAEYQKQTDLRSAVIDAVTNKCTVDTFPDGLLEARIDEYITGFEKQYCTDGTSLEDYLSTNYGTTEEAFRSQITQSMEDNLKQELIFKAIAQKEKIEFDQEDFDTYISQLMTNAGFSSEDNVYEAYGPNKEAGKKYLQEVYLMNKACDKIAEKASVTYTEGTESAEGTEAVQSTEDVTESTEQK